MKFVSSVFVVVATSLFVIACSGSSRPVTKPTAGPPPEYEAPRSFDLPKAPGEEAPPAASVPASVPAPIPAPPADEPAPTP